MDLCSWHGPCTYLSRLACQISVHAGMGCSSSIVAIDLVRHLFKSVPNTLALIINHENITSQTYIGELH